MSCLKDEFKGYFQHYKAAKLGYSVTYPAIAITTFDASNRITFWEQSTVLDQEIFI